MYSSNHICSFALFSLFNLQIQRNLPHSIHNRTPYLPNLSSIFLLSLSFTSLTSSLLASYATLT